MNICEWLKSLLRPSLLYHLPIGIFKYLLQNVFLFVCSNSTLNIFLFY